MADETLADYPADRRNRSRDKKGIWALQVIRCLQKTGAANHIGRDAAWLITTIAATEDVNHYRGPVGFWNPQLMNATGFASKQSFLNARTKAVEAGWLVHIEGRKGLSAKYWTMIPDDAVQFIGADVVDGIAGPDSDQQFENAGPDSDHKPDRENKCWSGSGPVTGPQTGPVTGPHSTLPLTHTQDTEGASLPGKSSAKSDAKLTTFCEAWNLWHSSEIVRSKILDANAPGKTIVDAWNRSQRDPEQRARLDDLSGLRAAIEASQDLTKPAKWFDAAGLIGGRNSNRRWYAEQLILGTYRDKSGGGKASQNSEAEQAWQGVLDSLKKHNRFNPGLIQADVGELAFQAAETIGLKKIDLATDYDKRELKAKFLQAFSQGKSA